MANVLPLGAFIGYCCSVCFFFVLFYFLPCFTFRHRCCAFVRKHTATKQKNKAPNNPSYSALRLCRSAWLERCLAERPNHIINKTKDC